MYVKLPNGEEVKLDENLNIEEKLDLVKNTLIEWEMFCRENWNKNNVKYFLDSLSNYIVWHKENREVDKRGIEDKFVLSRKKVEKLNRFKKESRHINFSDLDKNERIMLLGE